MTHNFDTLAVHVGSKPDEITGAVINPISLSTTFTQSSASVPTGKYEYSRADNPNRAQFEQVTAALEKAKYGLAYSSGSAASANIIQALATGAHIVSVSDVYGGTHRYFTKVSQAHHTKVSFTSNLHGELESLIRPDTKLVWIESPSNPTLTLADIGHAGEIVQRIRARTGQELYLVVDNTFLSPYIQNPLVLGADIVTHSVTKYINGHSDVVMGLVLVNDDDLHERLRFLQNALGAVPSAFDSWLAHRGVKTLHLRVRAASHNAQRIAEFLESRIGYEVEAVNYPGLKSHPKRDLVLKQHRDGLGGGMISFQVRGGALEASKFCENTRIFALAESLGGVESLCEVPAAMTHAGIPAEARAATGVHDNLIRLSVGVEDADDLVADVAQALAAATGSSKLASIKGFTNGHN